MNNKAQPTFKDNNGNTILKFLWSELKPKGKILTPFNMISIPVVLLGLALIVIRFWKVLRCRHQPHTGGAMGDLDRF